MGRNKAELLYRGKTFAEVLIDKARRLGIEEIYVSGFTCGTDEKLHIVWDLYPDRGPLGGLHACMKDMNTPYCLVLPVDAPKLPLEVLEKLLAYHERRTGNSRCENTRVPVILWEHGERQEPLIAIYPTAMASVIEALIREGPAPVFRGLDRWGYESFRLEMEQPQVLNVNTPQLYEELLHTEQTGSS